MAGARASDWRIYRRLLTYVTPWAWCFVASFLGYVVYSLGTVLLADLMQYLLDALAGEAGKGFISGLVNNQFESAASSPTDVARIIVPVAILVLALTRALGFFAGSWFMSFVARNLVHTVRCELFGKMLSLPAAYFDRHNRGALVSKLTFNVEQVAGAATKALKIILRETLVVVGLLAYMLYLNWQLCLVFLAVAPFIALVVRYVGKKFRRYSRRIQDSMGDVTQLGSESVAAWREVRLYEAQAQQQQRFEKASNDNRTQSLRLALVEALSTPVIQGLLALALGTLVWFALSPALLEGFTPGSLAAFLTAAAQLGKPIRQLSG
ncbi:MAG: ABC transporter transmembrane domain-containing protein, partial [Halioglobus sp.]